MSPRHPSRNLSIAIRASSEPLFVYNVYKDPGAGAPEWDDWLLAADVSRCVARPGFFGRAGASGGYFWPDLSE